MNAAEVLNIVSKFNVGYVMATPNFGDAAAVNQYRSSRVRVYHLQVNMIK